jgi:hypothetical protein
MSSQNAQNVAREVARLSLGKSRNRTKVNLGKIAMKNGYSKHTADTPKNITETKSYKEIINPVIKQLEDERQAILERMKKTRNKAKYRDLTYSLDITTKNHQLLTGGKTENGGVSEIAELINSWIKKAK